MSVCNCQECERRRDAPARVSVRMWPSWSVGRRLFTASAGSGRLFLIAMPGEAIIASGSPEFIAAIARNL